LEGKHGSGKGKTFIRRITGKNAYPGMPPKPFFLGGPNILATSETRTAAEKSQADFA